MDVVGAAAFLWDDVVDGEVSVGEHGEATVAAAFLLSEEGAFVLVGVVWGDVAEVGAVGDVGAVCALVEESEFVVEACFDEVGGSGGDVDADPLAAEVFCGDAGGGASAEWVEDEVVFVGGGGDDAFEEFEGFLGWVFGLFLGLRIHGRDVNQDVGNCFSQ